MPAYSEHWWGGELLVYAATPWLAGKKFLGLLNRRLMITQSCARCGGKEKFLALPESSLSHETYSFETNILLNIKMNCKLRCEKRGLVLQLLDWNAGMKAGGCRCTVERDVTMCLLPGSLANQFQFAEVVIYGSSSQLTALLSVSNVIGCILALVLVKCCCIVDILSRCPFAQKDYLAHLWSCVLL